MNQQANPIISGVVQLKQKDVAFARSKSDELFLEWLALKETKEKIRHITSPPPSPRNRDKFDNVSMLSNLTVMRSSEAIRRKESRGTRVCDTELL